MDNRRFHFRFRAPVLAILLLCLGLFGRPAYAGIEAAPMAQDDTYSVDEDSTLIVPASVGVLLNDSDPDGDPLTAILQNTPSHGTVTLAADGSFDYIPTPGFSGNDMFMYRASDGIEQSLPAKVNITVIPFNDPPIAISLNNNTIAENQPSGTAVGSFSTQDPDAGDTFTYALVDGSGADDNSSFSISGSSLMSAAVFDFETKASYSIRVRSTDSGGLFIEQPFTISVTNLNETPTAAGDEYSTPEDVQLVVAAPGVLANDNDPDGDPLTAILQNGPNHGSLNLDSNGAFSYTPNPGFSGADSFTYMASDGSLQSSPVTVSITVTPVNDPPSSLSLDNNIIAENQPSGTLVGSFSTQDPDANESFTYQLVDGAGSDDNGSFSISGSSLMSAAVFDFEAKASYSIRVRSTDSGELFIEQPFTISVLDQNEPPVVVGDEYSTPEDVQLVVAAPGVLANDLDPDGDTLTAELQNGPDHGSLTLNPDGSFSYTPASNFNGSDSFTYTASDGTNSSSLVTVLLTVTAVNDPPAAVNDQYSTPEDTELIVGAPGVLLNDADVDGDALTAVLVNGPSNGLLTLNPDGSFNYNPDLDFNGSDSFTYTAGDGALESNVATVQLTITPVNDPPVANDDSLTTPEDTPIAIDVLANDTDPDGFGDLQADSVTVTLAPEHGSIQVNTTNGVITYTPAANYIGPDSFTYKVCDAGQPEPPPLCDEALVNINVGGANDAPIVNPDAGITLEDTPLTLDVLANDTDPDGIGDINRSSLQVIAQPAHGSMVVNLPAGTLTYTPNSNYYGDDSAVYQVCDQAGACGSAGIDLTITPVNDAPIAGSNSYTVNAGEVLNVPAPGVLVDDVDVEVSPLSAVLVSGPAYGALNLNADGSFTYTPGSSFAGEDIFTYRASDGELSSAPAAVTIHVVDTVLPLVSWSQPVTNGERYDVGNQMISLLVAAQDNVGVDNVRLYRWDAVLNQYVDIIMISSSPYSFEFDTTPLDPEWNQVFARAYDTAGNASERQFIWLFKTGPKGNLTVYLPVVHQ